MTMPLTVAEQEQIICKAFEWLQAYRTLSQGRTDLIAVPERAGSRYEAWATLTLVYVLSGFSRNFYPMNQLFEKVQVGPDFLLQVSETLRVLENEAEALRQVHLQEGSALPNECD